VEEVFSFWLKMAPLAQGVGQNGFSAITSGVSNLDTSEVMAEKQFLTNLLGKWRYLEPK
jgi:hypothetical protein